MLYDTMGYMLKVKDIKSCGCKVFYVGFPASALDKVLSELKQQGGLVVRKDDNIVELSGISVIYDEARMNHNAVEAILKVDEISKLDSLKRELSLASHIGATPIECMIFIDLLQKKIQSSMEIDE